MGKTKQAQEPVDFSQELEDWEGVARSLGWGPRDIKTIRDYKAMPTTGIRTICNVFKVTSTVIKTATLIPSLKKWPAHILPPRHECAVQPERERWGVCSWPKSYQAPIARTFARAEGHDYCRHHLRDTPHNDESDCKLCLDERSVRQRLEDADILHLIEEWCSCPNGHLGEHWPDCEIYQQEQAEREEAIFGEHPISEEEFLRPKPPPTKKVDKLSKKELAKMPLPGQKKLFD